MLQKRGLSAVQYVELLFIQKVDRSIKKSKSFPKTKNQIRNSRVFESAKSLDPLKAEETSVFATAGSVALVFPSTPAIVLPFLKLIIIMIEK